MSWSLMLMLGIFISATLLITIWQASSIGQVRSSVASVATFL
jgi:hypothetical protein